MKVATVLSTPVRAETDPNSGADSAMTLENVFRTHQRALWGLAYRMTGCAADADDVVQETFARAIERDRPFDAMSWKPWLMRVAVNLSIDTLRRRRRQAYTGTWLPSPVETEDTAVADTDCPETRYAQVESISYAFLLALEALSPRQRAVLLLRDVFDFSGRDVADALSISEANVRITHHRARRTMQEYDRSRCVPTRELQERTATALAELLRCLVTQDERAIRALLTEQVRTTTDGAGEYTALHVPLIGIERVARFHLRAAQHRLPGGVNTRVRLINGLPALVIEYGVSERRQAPRLVLRCETDDAGRIVQLHAILAPRKLSAIRFETMSS